jgi:hypothetical protein
MNSNVVNDYFWNGKYTLIKKHVTSSTGLQNNVSYPHCRTRSNGLMAASLVDVQNMINLAGGVPGMSGPANCVQNYGGGISTSSCLMNPNLGSKNSFLDSLRGKVASKDGGYCLIYYAGHGTPDGNLFLSEKNIVSPQEIFNISKESKLPFLIILDMCYAGKFGEEYLKLIRENEGEGIILCSSGVNQESYEHGLMRKVSFKSNPIVVQGMFTPNFSLGQGIFSAAFIVALQELRNLGDFNFQEFIDKINGVMGDFRNLINSNVFQIEDKLPEQRAVYYKK